jgi:hypothetical protein
MRKGIAILDLKKNGCFAMMDAAIKLFLRNIYDSHT